MSPQRDHGILPLGIRIVVDVAKKCYSAFVSESQSRRGA